MSVQQSINQSILAAGALYSQSGAAEQRKGKLELEKQYNQIKTARKWQEEQKQKGIPEKNVDGALEEYIELKAQKLKDLGAQYGNMKAFRMGRDFTPEGKKRRAQELEEEKKKAQEAWASAPPDDYDPEQEDELASRSERQAVDEYEQAAKKEKDRREKRIMMRQANRAAVQKRMEMLVSRDFRQDMFGGN